MSTKGLMLIAALAVGCNTGSGLLAPSIQECVRDVGWQADFTEDASMNGVPDATAPGCDDATTAWWYEEDPATSAFTYVLAWDVVSTCSPRVPPPAVDGTLCTFQGTHAWAPVAGFDPSERMLLTEQIDAVSGDFYGDGTDSKCGPASVLEGTVSQYVVQLDGVCESGTKTWLWAPLVDATEPFPGDVFRDPGGAATPAALCTAPGTLGPADHLVDRRICPTSFVVADSD